LELEGNGNARHVSQQFLGRKLDSIPFSPTTGGDPGLGLVGFTDGYDLALTVRCSCWPRTLHITPDQIRW